MQFCGSHSHYKSKLSLSQQYIHLFTTFNFHEWIMKLLHRIQIKICIIFIVYRWLIMINQIINSIQDNHFTSWSCITELHWSVQNAESRWLMMTMLLLLNMVNMSVLCMWVTPWSSDKKCDMGSKFQNVWIDYLITDSY